MSMETTTPPFFTFELHERKITQIQTLASRWANLGEDAFTGTSAVLVLIPLFAIPLFAFFMPLPAFVIKFSRILMFLTPLLIYLFIIKNVKNEDIIPTKYRNMMEWFLSTQIHLSKLSLFADKLVIEQGESFLEIAKKWRFLQVPALPPLAFSYQEMRIMHLQHIVKPETWLKGAPPAEILLKFQTDTGSFSCEMRLHHAGQIMEMQKMLQFLYEKGLKIEERNHEGDVLYLLQNQSPSGRISPYYQQLIEEIGKN